MDLIVFKSNGPEDNVERFMSQQDRYPYGNSTFAMKYHAR